MTAMPPSRYKVVERGRRLVVIDTLTGRPASPEHGSVEAPAPRSRGKPPSTTGTRPVEELAARRIDDRSGAAIVTTSPLYDLKAPRSIVLDDRFNDRIGKAIGGWMIGLFSGLGFAIIFFPWLMVVPVIALLQPKVRAAIRQWITSRLDEVQAAS
ncbi:hypothetical protein ABS767_03350 [Sphingomonas sp. ST-64]|uniref:Uncharacterized protein n=1 Tax=Sphingomonas plantiphila TaxID=3163295 RepID=A0ABW8YL59_9SPHN